MSKKPRLGRGLEALLGANTAATPAESEADGQDQLTEVPVEALRRGRYQPRTDMRQDSLEDLAASIKSQGLVQPIVVRPTADGPTDFEIIAGERRWRAAQIAGIEKVPVVIRDVPDRAVVAMALIENIQRENLNPLEEATALQRLIAEFDMTHQEAADAVGRSRAAVSNLLRLLELHEQVKSAVENRQLEMGHARALLALPMEQQPSAARKIVAAGMSVRSTEKFIKSLLAPKPEEETVKSADPDIRRLQDELGERLGARTEIKHGKAGKGSVVINYNSLDELDGILERIR
ncbi:MAG: ParB/RepB/Spo0J family partition protein [Gammaproteobacteria bacterium]